jgi:hypothetical protein
MLNEERFFSPYGIRSLSRWHLEHPFVFNVHGEEYKIDYLPAESNNGLFGGAMKFQEDPNWQDHLLFYEYFHGDNGAGLGASHQTG